MDAKSIKSHLKEAKEAIKNKEIEKALKLCKAVLKADRNNYLALVIFGAALQESESKSDAVNAFKKAVEIAPKQILAWQGLASYYEKEGDEKYHRELTPVYRELLILETDTKKQKDIVKKLENFLEKYSCADLIVDNLKPFLSGDSELGIFVVDLLCKYFTSLKQIPDNFINCFKECLRIKIDACGDLDGLLAQYCKLLYEQKDYEELITYCQSSLAKYEDNIEALEWLCRMHFESFLNLIPKSALCDTEYSRRILELKDNNVYGLLVKAANFYNQRDFISCRDILNDVADIDKRNPYVWYFLSKVNFVLNAYEDVISNASIAEKYLPKDANQEIRKNLQEWKLQAFANSNDLEKCEKCIELCHDLSGEFVEKCLIQANIELGNYNVVESKLKTLNEDDPFTIYLKALYNFKTNKFDEAVTILKQCTQEKEEYAKHFLLLGKLYRSRGNNKEALTSFLKAAKLAPHIYTSFLQLGHYYRDVNNDLEKARRCYQKAFQLNPRSEETGISLSDVYRKLNCQESNLELLNVATATGAGNWVWLRLGLYYLDVNNIKSAVDTLRTAVRVSPNDSRCWECLGDAYYSRGSYTSALKCYQKCLEFNANSLYATLQIAYIKLRISLFDESISEFRILVEKNSDYIPALKGLAEVCLSQARELFDRQIVGVARDLCEEAATNLTQILKQNGKLASVWKLFADVCMLACQLPAKLRYMNMSAALFEKNDQKLALDARICVDGEQLLDFALKCYLVAVNLNSDTNILSFLWHDIAICYNLRVQKFENSEKIQYRKYALIAAKKSVSLLPRVWEHWNLLGVIALSEEIKNLKLAQHCFIKAIKLDGNCAVSWTNLGILYLQLKDIQLANEAFQNAQRSDPKYSRSWIGQALIAESVDHVETMDLFYHTTQLGYHDESAKGFAEWICKVLKNWETYKSNHHCYYIVEKMDGLQVAATVLNWYTVHYPGDACGMNMLGVLLELCKLNRSAVSVSENALKCVTDESDIVRSNLGRQLRKIGKYTDAIKVYEGVKQTDFSTQCDLALTTFLAGQHDKALTNYDAAIHWFAPDEGSVAQVMVATAALNFMQKKTEEAQTILFQCIQLKPVPVHGLFAACAFGMLSSSLKLSKLVLKELEAFKNQTEYVKHIAIFKSYCEVFQENFKSAISVMSRFIFNHPGDASLWFSLCLLLLRLIYTSEKEFGGLSMSSAYHAKCAITLGRGTIDISKICSVMSLSCLLAGKAEESLRSSMKAVHMYPDVAENWAVLIAAQYSRGNDYKSLLNIITHVRCKLTCSRPLNTWLGNIERKVTNILG